MGVGGVYSELVKYIASVDERVSLGQFNQFGVGGTADYFTVAHDTIELVAALRVAMDLHVPYFVMGLGEGTLFSDGGFPGLVIQNVALAQGVAAEHSQIIVDSGMPLRQFITSAASRGFGGLTNLYGVGGTIGATIYSNVQAGGQQMLDSVRYVTLLLPPTKMKVEATVVRYKSDWLLKDGGELTRLQRFRQEHSIDDPHPIILNAHIQLTSIRADEVIRRIQQQAQQLEESCPRKMAFGPIFAEVPGSDINLLLATSNIDKIRHEGVQSDRRYPNFLRRGKTQPSAAAVWQTCEEMRAAVHATHRVELRYAFERVGVW